MGKDKGIRGFSSSTRRAHGPLAGAPWVLLRLACAVPLLCALPSCVGQPTQSAYRSAEKAVAEEDWDQAAELWNDIQQGEKHKSERAYVETAHALFESGDKESACSMLRLGRENYPASPGIYALYGDILEKMGYTRAAEDAYTSWTEYDPDNPQAFLCLGRTRLSLGWEHAAGVALARSVELDPTNAQTQVQLARLYRASQEIELAYEHFQLSWELGARDPMSSLDGSLAVMELGPEAASPELGLKWATFVTEQEPRNTCAHYLRGVHLQALGRRDEAIVAFRRVMETDPGCVEGLSRLARLYTEVGEAERLTELVTRALELETDPRDRERLLALVAPR